MEHLRWPRMSDGEVRAFLGDGGTGVISFTTDGDEPPHSIPVSYGFNAEKGHLHFRLAFPETSPKRDLIERPVAFVTYGETDAGWRSVVATGRLEDLTDAPYESSAVQERWAVSIPLFDLFEAPPEETAFRQFRLVPTG